jgi:hypothetical protein
MLPRDRAVARGSGDPPYEARRVFHRHSLETQHLCGRKQLFEGLFQQLHVRPLQLLPDSLRH